MFLKSWKKFCMSMVCIITFKEDVMEYEIWGMNDKDNMDCYISCKGSEVDKELERLSKKYPDINKWLFGMHIHFREFDKESKKFFVNWN